MINNSSTLSSWWNNFNNGDEALFQDAPRPRDSHWFKIQPWMQSDKWWWKDSMWDAYLRQLLIKWPKFVTWISDWNAVWWNPVEFKEEWTAADIDWVMGYHYWTSNANWYLDQSYFDYLKAFKKGSPWVNIKDWMAYCSWGTYFVQFGAEFIYPYQHDTTSNHKCWIELYDWDWKEWSSPVRIMATAQRACSSPDRVYQTYIWAVEKWHYLTINIYHTLAGTNVLCTGMLNFVQIS